MSKTRAQRKTRPRPFGDGLPLVRLRAHDATKRLFKPEPDRLDPTLPQWRVIRALAEEDARDAADLAERCALPPRSLSRIIAALEARRLIARSRACGDGRCVSLSPTPAGREMFDHIAARSETVCRQLETRFGAARLTALPAELEALRKVAESLPPTAADSAAAAAGKAPAHSQA